MPFLYLFERVVVAVIGLYLIIEVVWPVLRGTRLLPFSRRVMGLSDETEKAVTDAEAAARQARTVKEAESILSEIKES